MGTGRAWNLSPGLAPADAGIACRFSVIPGTVREASNALLMRGFPRSTRRGDFRVNPVVNGLWLCDDPSYASHGRDRRRPPRVPSLGPPPARARRLRGRGRGGGRRVGTLPRLTRSNSAPSSSCSTSGFPTGAASRSPSSSLGTPSSRRPRLQPRPGGPRAARRGERRDRLHLQGTGSRARRSSPLLGRAWHEEPPCSRVVSPPPGVALGVLAYVRADRQSRHADVADPGPPRSSPSPGPSSGQG